jgi:transposase-like protein
MPRQPDPDKQARWLELVRRWQRSTLTVCEFCEEQGLSEASFYAWRRTLRERGLLQSSRVSTTAPAFVKLRVGPESSAATPVEVVLAGRRRLRVRPGFDAETLRQLVRLLEEPTC